MEQDVQARITVSQPRRWLGIGMQFFLGGLLIYVALAQPPALGWQVMLLGLGLWSLWSGERMRRATMGYIEMTSDVLRAQSGEVIAHLDDIASVDRGMLAFKPSNGFLITTKTPASRRWEPGLWWRFGRRIGIGGVTAASQAKIMSDLISTRLAVRDQA